MKKIYVFPLVGAIVTLFGLGFPVVSVYDGVSIWLWGFYTVEHKNLEYFRITYEKEFETYFSSIWIFSFIIFLFILFSLIYIILISNQRVAKLYISKKTREFLSYITRRIEQLKNMGNLHESTEKFEEYLEKSFQIREKWALLLNNLIHEVPNKEISKEAKKELETVIKMYCEIRSIIFNKKILKEDKEKLIQERIEKCNPRFFKLFEILKKFLGIYDYYSRKWMEKSLIIEGKKTVR